MVRVPTELLCEIFIRLDLTDRIKCMLVCRSWYKVIDECCLLYDLDITTRQYHNLKVMMKRLPYRATQTEYLTLMDNLRAGFDKRELFNTFPNLRELILNTSQYQNFENHLSQPFHFAHPTSKLEIIKDFGECEVSRQLIISNLCKRLKSLTLSLRNFNGSIRNSIMTQLKSMPVLDHLGLISPIVRLMDLETLHHNLPSLKSLHFKYAALISGQIPRSVLPATLMTKLDLDLGAAEDLNTHIQLYKYMASKYPSANNPTFEDKAILQNDVIYARTIYNEGIIPFYQKVGSHIDTFSFKNYCDGLDAFRKFDESGMNLKELKINTTYRDIAFPLGELAQSQQAMFINKLTLVDIIPKPLEMMNGLESLTCLEVSTKHPDDNQDDESIRAIDFGQLVESCPATLLDLKLSSVYLTFNKATSNQTSIERLVLCYVPLDQRLANIIEASFPQLDHFLFDGNMRDDVTISLPKHNLGTFNIKIHYSRIAFTTFVITTTEDNKTEYYGKDESDFYDEYGRPCDCGEVICLPKEELNGGPVLRLTCTSIDELSLETNRDLHRPVTLKYLSCLDLTFGESKSNQTSIECLDLGFSPVLSLSRASLDELSLYVDGCE